ncbi:phage tail assembly chaperone [Pseudomonas sp. G.S.17]|uniref:phage tail assembly chaperone n=1 Tax=Pseudomonas sp. G.S.17 TaxID=3137451 RepID=UPI00311CBD57
MAAKPEKAVTPKTFALADFFTLSALEAGKKLPLTLPDGTATDHYLIVIGQDAPVARRALLSLAREGRDKDESKLSSDEIYDIQNTGTIKYRSALVTGWSFDAPFSRDAVAELLTQNPGLAQEVESFSNSRARFFAPELKAS